MSLLVPNYEAPASGAAAAAAAGLFNAYALYQDQKTAGTDGGTFTSGAWRKRTLNTEVFDPSGIGSLASDAVTLQAGTYYLSARAPALSTGTAMGRVQLKIVNDTDAADVASGPPIYLGSVAASSDDSGESVCQARVTIASAKAFSVQHRCETTVSTVGFGRACNFGVTEIYAELLIWREA